MLPMNRWQSLFDKAAVLISAFCALHCLALPLLLIVFPVLGSTLLSDELFHQMLLWVIAPTSLIALGLARLHHPDGKVANSLTNDTLTEWGGGVAYSDTLVQIEAG